MKGIKKKLATLFIAATLCVRAFGLGDTEEYKVGILKIASHPALDAIEQGIQDELERMRFKAIQYYLHNVDNDLKMAADIARKFRDENYDIAVGIATQTSYVLVQTLREIPVVFTGVTDSVYALLVDSLENGVGNVTGFSDMSPVDEQIELISRLGDIRRIGHIYSASDANAIKLAELAKRACAALDIEFVAALIASSNEVAQATRSIIDKVDAIYISTDNRVVAELSTVTSFASENGIPIISADPSSAEQLDILAAYGFDYYAMGVATGQLIARVLHGEKPAEIPVQFLTDEDDMVLLINLDLAKSLSIDLDADLLSKADIVIENGVKR